MPSGYCHKHRDSVLLADCHGLRVAELCALRREQVDLRRLAKEVPVARRY
jgi:integrase